MNAFYTLLSHTSWHCWIACEPSAAAEEAHTSRAEDMQVGKLELHAQDQHSQRSGTGQVGWKRQTIWVSRRPRTILPGKAMMRQAESGRDVRNDLKNTNDEYEMNRSKSAMTNFSLILPTTPPLKLMMLLTWLT